MRMERRSQEPLLVVLLLGVLLCGSKCVQARDLQQTADTAGAASTPPGPFDVNPQAAAGSSRPAAPAADLFATGAAAASAPVDELNLPKEVEVVKTQTAGESLHCHRANR